MVAIRSLMIRVTFPYLVCKLPRIILAMNLRCRSRDRELKVNMQGDTRI